MKKHSEGFINLVNKAKDRITEISIEETQKKIKNREEIELVDVREDHEWEKGHIPGARHIGKGIFERDIEKEIPDPNKEIILYCGGGYRSALADDNLQKTGYRNVKSIDGGFRGWKDKGYEKPM